MFEVKVLGKFQALFFFCFRGQHKNEFGFTVTGVQWNIYVEQAVGGHANPSQEVIYASLDLPFVLVTLLMTCCLDSLYTNIVCNCA